VKVIEKELLEIEPGWYCVGRWCDVPRHARFVGRHNSTWVWVDPARQDDLTRFTLTVMKLGTLLKDTQTLISPGQVKFSPGDRGG
jgi:hypothetical protein